MRKYQAGGRKGYSINDQIFILRSIIENNIYYNRQLYLQFIDLKKAFDKMVLKNIMQDLWEKQIRGRIWRNIYKINKNAIIEIKTAFGNTNPMKIGEILKQGSVLAATLAALHTDNINKHFNNTGLGVYYSDILIHIYFFKMI